MPDDQQYQVRRCLPHCDTPHSAIDKCIRSVCHHAPPPTHCSFRVVLMSNDDAAIVRYNVTFDGTYDPATSPFIVHVIAGFLLPPSLASPPPVRK